MAKTPIKTEKHENYTHRLSTEDGHQLNVFSQYHVTGAFLEFPGRDHSLSVVSECHSGRAQNYIGYRDGKCNADKFSLSLGADGSVMIQVILSGHGDERNRCRHLTLEHLESLVADMEPEPE